MRPFRPQALPLIGVFLVSILLILSASLAAADPLRVGVFPRRDATTTVRMFTPLAEYLERELQRPVQLVTAKDFDAFWAEVKEKRFDLVHFNQLHAIKAHAFGYRVVASNQEFGAESMAGAIFVRKDSGIETLADLKGKKVVFGGGRDAMMSYIGPRFLLQQAGLNDADYTAEFALSPPSAVLAVIYRQADACGAGDVVIQQPLANGRADRDSVTILARTEPLRQLPWAIADTLSGADAARISELMLALGKSPAGLDILKKAGMTGISPASDADYEPHRRMAESVLGPLE